MEMFKYIVFYSVGIICVLAQTGWQSSLGYQSYPQLNYTGNRYNPIAQGGSVVAQTGRQSSLGYQPYPQLDYTGNRYNPTAQSGSWNYSGYSGNPYIRQGNGSAINSGYNGAPNGYNPQIGGYNATRTPYATSYLNRTRQDGFLPGTTSWQQWHKEQSKNGSTGFQHGNIQAGSTGPYGITNTTGIGGRFRSNSGVGYGFRNNSFPGQGSRYDNNAGGQIGSSGSWYNPVRGNLNSTNFRSGYNPHPNVGYNASQSQGFTGQGMFYGNRNTSGGFRGNGGNQGGFRASGSNYGQSNPIIY